MSSCAEGDDNSQLLEWLQGSREKIRNFPGSAAKCSDGAVSLDLICTVVSHFPLYIERVGPLQIHGVKQEFINNQNQGKERGGVITKGKTNRDEQIQNTRRGCPLRAVGRKAPGTQRACMGESLSPSWLNTYGWVSLCW